MGRFIGGICVGIVGLFVLGFALRAEWFDNTLSIEMPDWETIHVVRRLPATTSLPEPALVPPVVGSMSTVTKTEEVLPALTPARYAARGGQTWDNIALKTTTSGIGWTKSGTQCRIPAGGIVQKMEQWPSPQGDLDTYWRIQYVSQKNAIIENPPPMFYCAIGSSQRISDTLLETYYTPAP